MSTIAHSLLTPYFENYGFTPFLTNKSNQHNELLFNLNPEFGYGFYRLIPFGDQFWISVIDLLLLKDMYIDYPQFKFLSLSYYESAYEERQESQVIVSSSVLRGYKASSSRYQSTIYANIPFRSTSIILLPGYYESRLRNQYPDDYHALRNLLESIEGPLDIPELSSLLLKMKHYQSTGLAARVFYESTVAQAISLLAEYSQNKNLKIIESEKRILSKEDQYGISAALSVIDERFTDPSLRIDTLARAAVMSPTKFKQIFKLSTGHTVSAFILVKRMSYARLLLKEDNTEIGQIAHRVGYNKAGNFSAVFKKYHGMLPHVYRKNSRNAGVIF